jgi:hypothetical protein
MIFFVAKILNICEKMKFLSMIALLIVTYGIRTPDGSSLGNHFGTSPDSDLYGPNDTTGHAVILGGDSC